MEVVASLSQGRTAAAQCGLFTYKSVPVIFEPPCTYIYYQLLPTPSSGRPLLYLFQHYMLFAMLLHQLCTTCVTTLHRAYSF